jgi:acyl-CoA dehydrogenase
MAWDFSTDAEFEEQLDWMRTFVREEVWPLETLDLNWEQLKVATAPLKQRVKDRGLWAAHLDPALGGQGYGQVKLGLMHEIIGTSQWFYASLVFGNQGPDSGNAEILAINGTPEQKEQFLTPLLAGEVMSSFAMTERDTPGSDPTMLATRAAPTGDGYVINGRKWFISNGSIADFFIVMAVVDPDAPRHERASMFLVPADTPGVDVIRDIGTIEHTGENFGAWNNHSEILFEDVHVPASSLLGPVGGGFRLSQERLGPGRIHHCMRWLGLSRRALNMLLERAHTRSTHGSLLKDKDQIKIWIADSEAEMAAARLMTLHAAWIIDQRGSYAARKEIAMIKYYGAKVLHDVIDRSLQVHGSLGYSSDLPLELMYRFARGARIYDGPDEVHKQTVARFALKASGPAPGPDGLPSEHIPTRRAAAIAKYGDLLDLEAAAG